MNGVIYVVFGARARKCCEASLASLRMVEPDIPVAVVGDESGDIPGTTFIRWKNGTPYNPQRQTGFQFMAGRVKPFLYDLTPFDKTLYVDADTEFKQSIQPGFALLDQYDIMYARHSWHNVGMLNNYPSKERQATMDELHTGDVPYPNSGVVFWRHGWHSMQVFQNWYSEWMRFQEWDEQCALMRAVYKNPCRLLILPEAWNGENRKEGAIIFHDFHGRKEARIDAPMEATFTSISETGYWQSKESKSGVGSEIKTTVHVREMLPAILNSLKPKVLLDAGCGDWNWMKEIYTQIEAEYHGCDIVQTLIDDNKVRYPDIDFFQANLISDDFRKLKPDVILCRSVLFHLTYANALLAIQNFKRTKAKWLLTTTYPFLADNTDVQDGHWRRLNMEKPPFNFPAPYLLIPEGLERDGWLALYLMSELP